MFYLTACYKMLIFFMKYDKIKNKSDYDTLLGSGLFFELYPELSGIFKDDELHFIPECKICYDFGYIILSDGKNLCPNCGCGLA